jgi:hypothetical protein
LETWTGIHILPEEYSPTKGVHIHTKDSIVAPQTVVSPHSSFTAIVMIDQGVNEEWPIELYTRDGIAKNITLEKGMVLLIESGSIIHGVRERTLKKKIKMSLLDIVCTDLANTTRFHTHTHTHTHNTNSVPFH